MREKIKRCLSSVGLIVVVAFLVRLFLVVILYHRYGNPAINGEFPFGHYGETGWIASSIAAGRGFSSPLQHFQTGPTAWLTPVFPYLLAAVFKIFGTYSYLSSLVIRSIDLAFSAFTCWPLYALGRKVFGQTTGKAAAWAWAFCPTAIYFPIMWMWDTTLAGLCMALLLLATVYLRGSDRASSWAGYGALWAFGAMVNASLVSVLPFLGLWAIWPLRTRLARASKLVATGSLIFLAGVAPWTIRNYVVFHKLIPLRSNFGLELWLGNNSQVPETWDPYLHPNENAQEAAKFVSMGEIAYMQEKQHEAFAFMRSHPLDTAHFAFRRFAENWLGTWDAPADVWVHSPLYVKLTMVWTFSFTLLSLFGVLFAYREGKPEASAFALTMLVFPLVFYFTHTSLRYRFPLDTLMQVLSVYAIVYALSKFAALWQAIPAAKQAHVSGAD